MSTKNALIDYLDLGVHIGLTGWICDDRRGKHLRDFIDIIPDDKLLIETDSPYLSPYISSKKAEITDHLNTAGKDLEEVVSKISLTLEEKSGSGMKGS